VTAAGKTFPGPSRTAAMTLESSLVVTVDDGVTFAFTVDNAGDEPRDLTFRDGTTADVVVSEPGDGNGPGAGAEVWRWSDGRMFTQAVRTVTLAPGESLTEELTWSDPPTGTYTAEASLAAADVDAVAGATFDV